MKGVGVGLTPDPWPLQEQKMKPTRAFWVMVLMIFAGLGSLAAPPLQQHQQRQALVAGPSPDARLKPGMHAEDVDPEDIGNWCTSIPVSKEASADGSCMTSHSCDGHYEIRIHIVPGGRHPKGAMRPVLKGGGLGEDRREAAQVGEIPEVETTFTRYDASYPFMNEKGVQIGETTISGKRDLYNSEGMFDIMALERVALERASTAREAIRTMGELATKYGYGDMGECLTVIDPNEAWQFEIFGAGPLEKGAVWAAARIPPGHVGVSANRPRIQTLDLANRDFYMASDNVMSVAEQMGWWKPGEPFVFNKAYSGQPSLGSTRREWRVLSTMAPSLHLDPWDPDLPFSVKAEKKVTVQDLMALHRDSYEGTEFDMTAGLAAGPWHDPNRWSAPRPPDGYMGFERTISVSRCSYTVVLNSRGYMPAWIGAVAWFTPDDAKTGVFVPFYAGNTSVPKAYEIGNRAVFDRNSAWWAFDFVGNWAQMRYDLMIQDIKAKRAELEGKFLADQAEVEKQALDLYKKDPDAARRFISDYSNRVAQQTFDEWWKLADALIVKYNDNSVNAPGMRAPGYPKEWLDATGYGTKKILNRPSGVQ
jgi:dipeptidase